MLVMNSLSDVLLVVLLFKGNSHEELWMCRVPRLQGQPEPQLATLSLQELFT
jgi:hypothetical protein